MRERWGRERERENRQERNKKRLEKGSVVDGHYGGGACVT